MAFDEYTGPALYDHTDGRKVVPIPPSARDFFRGSSACQRVQFPLALAHAVTVHKSLGLTLHLVVADLSRGEHQVGLSYVAVSRVRSLDNIMFEAPFDLEQLAHPPGRRDSRPTQARRTAQLLLPQ